jgi:hypothetical protein
MRRREASLPLDDRTHRSRVRPVPAAAGSPRSRPSSEHRPGGDTRKGTAKATPRRARYGRPNRPDQHGPFHKWAGAAQAPSGRFAARENRKSARYKPRRTARRRSASAARSSSRSARKAFASGVIFILQASDLRRSSNDSSVQPATKIAPAARLPAERHRAAPPRVPHPNRAGRWRRARAWPTCRRGRTDPNDCRKRSAP